jgi:ssDNA-binding Zn-finger/Zn-ribbon topoisomerase 1
MLFMDKKEEKVEVCPKCGKPLSEMVTTKTGKQLQRCSGGSWNPETRQNEGCSFVKWIMAEPQVLDEKCPKCGEPLVLAITRFGKKMKKCSKSGWDSQNRVATGCDYIEWINGTTEPLDEICPTCGEKLVLYTTASGKRMKKCSTSGWDKVKREATGCTYVQWLKPGEGEKNGEEFLPPED